MQVRNSALRYGAVAQLLHWSIVALIVAQFVLATQAADLPLGAKKLATLTLHKNLGMTILMLAVVRLGWRLVNPVPAPPTMPRWQYWLALISHWGLYALILATPLVGWIMSSAKNYSVSYFGYFTFPNLVSQNEMLFEQSKLLHKILAYSILNLAALHVLGALKHHFIDRDNVLRRMLPMKLREEKA